MDKLNLEIKITDIEPIKLFLLNTIDVVANIDNPYAIPTEEALELVWDEFADKIDFYSSRALMNLRRINNSDKEIK